MEPTTSSHELEIFKKEANDTLFILNAKVLEDGDVAMQGHDIGEAALETWGHDDYEYMVKVPASHKEYLLLLLIKERFNTAKPSSDFMEWLKAHNIPHEFSSYP